MVAPLTELSLERTLQVQKLHANDPKQLNLDDCIIPVKTWAIPPEKPKSSEASNSATTRAVTTAVPSSSSDKAKSSSDDTEVLERRVELAPHKHVEGCPVCKKARERFEAQSKPSTSSSSTSSIALSKVLA